jgi:hypothetical protein
VCSGSRASCGILGLGPGGALTLFAIVSVFAARAHRRHEAPHFIGAAPGRRVRKEAKLPSPPASTAAATLMVGRESELVQLRDWFASVRKGERRVVFVSGEAGIGKTAFMRAFLDSLQKNGAVRIGRGQCVEQYGAGEPYMPMLEALTQLGRGAKSPHLLALLHRLAPAWLAQLPALLTAAERTRIQGETHGLTQQRMLREMAETLAALAAEAPLVLLFEDLHWSDASTLELIAAIARRTEPAQLLVIGTYRPVEVLAGNHPLRALKQELHLHQQCEELRLKRLSEAEVAAYLRWRFANDGSQYSRLAPAIYQRSEGNPLFMVNVVDYLAAQGPLLDTSKIEAPRNILQMIERNLDRLSLDERRVLQAASVAGSLFSAASIAAAADRLIGEIEECCSGLARQEHFIGSRGATEWPDATVAGSYALLHALYLDVLYERTPPGQRVELHRRIADRVEAAWGERTAEIAAELAHHFSSANHRQKGIQYFQLAGERAVARGAVVEAEGHYRRALKMLGELQQDVERDRRELALQIALGDVLWSSRSWSHPEAGRAFARAEELAEKLGEANQLVVVLMGLKSAANGSGQFKLARELAGRMLVAAEHGGDRGALCMAHTRLGDTLISRAQYIEAQKHLELGNSYYDEANPGELALMGIDALALAAIVALLLGFPDRARQLMKDGLRRAERRDDPFWLGIVHMWGGMVSAVLRDAGRALEHAQALRRLAAKQPVFEGLADENTGRALMFQGSWHEGVAYSRQAVPRHRTAGLLSHLTWAKLDEAEFFASQGQIADGLALTADPVADSEEYALIKSPTLRQRADLLAQSNADALTIDAAYRVAIDLRPQPRCQVLRAAGDDALRAMAQIAGARC